MHFKNTIKCPPSGFANNHFYPPSYNTNNNISQTVAKIHDLKAHIVPTNDIQTEAISGVMVMLILYPFLHNISQFYCTATEKVKVTHSHE